LNDNLPLVYVRRTGAKDDEENSEYDRRGQDQANTTDECLETYVTLALPLSGSILLGFDLCLGVAVSCDDRETPTTVRVRRT
jgi:hypothetical protein